MGYAALTNWKYDKNLYHNIQSGPQRTGSNLDLIDTYKLIDRGYRMPNGKQQTYYTVASEGADFGIITPGPPMTFPEELDPPKPFVETRTFAVSVQNNPTGPVFLLDGVAAQNLTLYQGSTYIFDLSSPTTAFYQFFLSQVQDGTFNGGQIFTENVTKEGTQGLPGAKLTIVIEEGLDTVLYPFSTDNAGMGTSAQYDVVPTFLVEPKELGGKFEVTVVATPAGNRFALNGVVGQSLLLYEGRTYVFELDSPSTANHPFLFSRTKDGTNAGGVIYTDGVVREGLQGQPGAFVELTVQEGELGLIYPFCPLHPGMGGDAQYDLNGPIPRRPIFQTTDWRQVPPAVPGFWTNYNFWVNPQVKGELNVQDGFRYQNIYKSPTSATVQTALGPPPGVRDIGSFTWWDNSPPSTIANRYQPFETPTQEFAEASSSFGENVNNSTGGPITYPRVRMPACDFVIEGSRSRADYIYHPPVYCQTFTETIRTGVPGAMGERILRMYRGRSSRYVYNYGSVYGVGGEAARNIQRTFSASVNGAGQMTK